MIKYSDYDFMGVTEGFVEGFPEVKEVGHYQFKNRPISVLVDMSKGKLLEIMIESDKYNKDNLHKCVDIVYNSNKGWYCEL